LITARQSLFAARRGRLTGVFSDKVRKAEGNEAEVKELHATIGKRVVENDFLSQGLKPLPPFAGIFNALSGNGQRMFTCVRGDEPDRTQSDDRQRSRGSEADQAMQTAQDPPVVTVLLAGRRECRDAEADDRNRPGLSETPVLSLPGRASRSNGPRVGSRQIAAYLPRNGARGPTSGVSSDWGHGVAGCRQRPKYAQEAPPQHQQKASSAPDLSLFAAASCQSRARTTSPSRTCKHVLPVSGCSDITCIPVRRGFLYLVAILWPVGDGLQSP